MSAWTLHPRLAADTHFVRALALSDVLLMDDAQYPWLILVPRIAGATEWVDLDPADAHRLLDEIAIASTALRGIASPDKLNVAALGNVVAQLHVHVVARYTQDAAWPRPVWGALPAQPYTRDALDARLGALRQGFGRLDA